MKTVIIVDDEYIVAQGLAQLIQWNDFGMEVGGVAYDGESALSLIERIKPALVFTDIRMPGMNGLDLIRRAKRFVPAAEFVIISGFNDFEYIRSALRLNVFDYVDKPITVEKMYDVLTRYQKTEDGVGKTVNDDLFRERMQKCVQMCQAFDNGNGEQIADLWREKGLRMPEMTTLLCVRAECPHSGTFGWLEYEMGHALKEINLSMVSARGACGGLIVFFSAVDAPEESTLFARLQSVCDRMAERGVLLHTGVSRVHTFVYDIPTAAREAKAALSHAVFVDEHYVYVGDIDRSVSLPPTINTIEQSVAFSMRVGDRAGVEALVSSLIDSMIQSGISMELFCHELLEMIYMGLRVLRDADVAFDLSPTPPHVEIEKYRSASELRKWVLGMFDRMMRNVCEQNQFVARKSVDKAKEYIDRYYNQPITLERLAQICGMNPTYFSILFKEQVGQTYVKYICQVRMERARDMLLGGLSIRRVSESAGFTSQRYFCDRFKVYWGCTPTQLREKMMNRGGKTDENDI